MIELEGGLAIPCTIPGNIVPVKACLIAHRYTIHGSLICPDCRLLCDVSENYSNAFSFSSFHLYMHLLSDGIAKITHLAASKL